MEIGDVVEHSKSIKRWARLGSGRDVTTSGLVLRIIHHDILDASVYEVMWTSGKIDRHYSSSLVVVKD